MSCKYMIDFGSRYVDAGSGIVCPMDDLCPEQHDYLFAYADKSSLLASLDGKISRYVSGAFADPSVLVSQLEDIHPFFKMFPDAVWDVLDRTIAEKVSETDRSEDGRKKLFLKKAVGAHSSPDDYDDYVKRSCDSTDIQSLADSVSDAHDFLSFILADYNDTMTGIPHGIRNSMYILNSHASAVTDIRISYELAEPASVRSLTPVLDLDDALKHRLIDSSKDAADGKPINDDWKSIMKNSSDGDLYDIIVTYHVSSFEEMIRLELLLMAGEGIRVKKCRKCHRLFPVYHEGQEFCDFSSEEGMSCYRRSLSGRVSSDMSAIYRKGYRTHFARVRNGMETRDDLDVWMTKAKAVKDEYLKNGRSAADYDAWMKEDTAASGNADKKNPS